MINIISYIMTNINTICRKFHNYLNSNNYDLIENEILSLYSIDKLIEMNNKGLISLLFQYYIYIKNNDIINKIKPYLSMKRDYLILINYIKKDELECLNIFKNKIDFDSILSKDIDFIIDNNLTFLLKSLDGKFIKIEKDYIQLNYNLKQYYLSDPHLYINLFKKNIKEKEYNNFIKILNNNYKYIIDGGNILHSRNGTINDFSSIDLEKVINKYEDSLTIIHSKHLKNDKIKKILSNKLYYATPYRHNDDIFIILAYLNNHAKIITNDNFKDHTINNNDFRNYLIDNLIKYTHVHNEIIFNKELSYSNCIQIINDNIYIPCNNGFINVK